MTADAPRQYLRRCNGQPPEGMPVTGYGPGLVPADSKDVRQDSSGRISWTSGGRWFTLDPVAEKS